MCFCFFFLRFFRIELEMGKDIEKFRCVFEVDILIDLKIVIWKKEISIFWRSYILSWSRVVLFW